MRLHHLFETARITDSPGFQRWFAGSQIVDAEGNPLKLYHGTSKDQDFRKFRVPGNGVWFTSNPKDASNYAEENDSQGYVWDKGHPVRTHLASRVIPVYVRAVNPLRIETLPDKLRYANNYRAAQREWFNQIRAQGYDALVIGDTVVVLKDANQIKSAIGNKTFNPAKAGFTEAAIPFGQTVDASGFTFGFEAEFLISEGYMLDKSANDIDELAGNEGTAFLERHFNMPDLDDAFEQWQEEHPDEDIEEMLNDLGAREFLKRVGAEPHDDVRYDPDTGQFANNEKSQADAFYDVADDLSEEVGIHPRIFQEQHQRDKAFDEWYLEPDNTVSGRGFDYDAELTSPIIHDYEQFLDDMNYVFAWMSKHDTDWVYTNGTCGLHINIGPPTSFDPIKFLVFAGEGWLAKLFPRDRSTSNYVDPLIGNLRDKAKFARSFDNFIRRLIKQLKNLNDKTFTINFLPWFEGKKYVEVRVIGGAGYEKRLPEIKRQIDRLLVLFKIASNPAKFRQAYMQKVYRYFIGDQPDALVHPQQTMAARQFITYARQIRMPDDQIDRFVSDGRIDASPQQVFEWVLTMLLNDKPVPTTVLKLVCREIGLKRSQIAALPTSLPRYWIENNPEVAATAVDLLMKCAAPG